MLDSPCPSTSGMRSWVGATLAFGLVVTIGSRSPSHTAASRNALAPGSRNRYYWRSGLPVLSLSTLSVMCLS